MKLHPRVTKTAVELVERFEGLRRRAARLPDGGWTIGYGHTLTAREGGEVNEEEAELLLYYDLSAVATKIEAWTFTPLNQNQFEALTAFAFNIGLENFRRSTVLKRVNEGQHLQAAAAMELWRKTEVDGEDIVADALVRRRAAEKAHYLTPPEGFRPSPTQVLKPVYDFSVIEAAAQSHLAKRATVIDAPLEGEHAVAAVERPAEPDAPLEPKPEDHIEPGPAEPAHSPAQATPDGPHAPAVEAHPDGALLAAPVVALAAAATADEVLHAPAHTPDAPSVEPHTPTEPLLVAEPAPPLESQVEAALTPAEASDAASLDAPPFTGPASNPVGFRNFEPPPRRFAAGADLPPPPPANEAEAIAPSPPAGEPVPEFNLFDRPLSPPEPTPPPTDTVRGADVRTLRLRDDELPSEARPSMASRINGRGIGALQDRTVLFSSVGLLGVAMFAATIATMLFGKATPAHLLVGLFGVALITVAGIYFLLRHNANGHAEADPHTTDEPLLEAHSALD